MYDRFATLIAFIRAMFVKMGYH